MKNHRLGYSLAVVVRRNKVRHGRIDNFGSWSPERHDWLDLERYRELLQILAWRDTSVGYNQTAIGALWAIIRPLLTMVLFMVNFGRLANSEGSKNAPGRNRGLSAAVCEMLPWIFFRYQTVRVMADLALCRGLLHHHEKQFGQEWVKRNDTANLRVRNRARVPRPFFVWPV